MKIDVVKKKLNQRKACISANKMIAIGIKINKINKHIYIEEQTRNCGRIIACFNLNFSNQYRNEMLYIFINYNYHQD